MTYKALIVDDDDDVAFALCMVLKTCKFKARHAQTVEQALGRYLREETFHLAICDWRFPEKVGLSLIERLHDACPATYTVMLTAFGTTKVVRAAFKRGAADYFDKPIENEQVAQLCQRVVKSVPMYLPNKLLAKPPGWVEFEGMRSRAKPMIKAFDVVRDAAPLRRLVFLIGENGVGKASLAQAIHNRSSVANGPFIHFRTDGYSSSQIERMLFGSERKNVDGLPTSGPDQRGFIEQANGGTLYIDNVAGFEKHVQAQLIEYLFAERYRRVGSTQPLKASTRIVFGQSGNPSEISSGLGFLPALEHELQGGILKVPSLRERRRDIPLLVEQILAKLRKSGDSRVESLTPQTEERLMSYDWPGNLPELESVIKLATFGTRSAQLQVGHLPQHVSGTKPVPSTISLPLGMRLEHIEREAILQTLSLNDDNRNETALMLGISRRTLQRKLSEYEELDAARGPESPTAARVEAAEKAAEELAEKAEEKAEGGSAPDAVVVKPEGS